MPSTYTVNLGIEKIATGEQSGTWGDTTNTNLDLIDEAVNGVVVITLASAGTSGSPNALEITNGTSSNGRNKYIEFTDGGDLGATAYVQLTPNDAEKVVHIRNNLSGSQSLIIFQGTYNASNDYEIPAGKDVVLKFDGGGAGAVVSQVFEDLYVESLTSAGNVGIGKDAPAQLLHIKGDDTATGYSAPGITIEQDGTGDASINFLMTGVRRWLLGIDNSDSDKFKIVGSNQLDFTDPALTIDTSNNVGINSSDPDTILEIDAGVGSYLQVLSGGDNITRLRNYKGGDTGFQELSLQGSDISFRTGTAGGSSAPEVMRIDDSGNLDLTTGGGNIIMADGAGIDFSASEGGGATSSVLDDYERGTWTPEARDSSGNVASASIAVGNYTKVGNIVFATFQMSDIDTTGLSSNDFRIRGFPFASSSLGQSQFFMGEARLNNVTFAGNPALGMLDNTDFIRIIESISGSTSDFVTVNQLTSGSNAVIGSLTYMG